MPPSPPAPIEGWEVLDLLTGLVQRSLVVYEEDEQGHGRYRLLETVRQYARDRLPEAGEGEAVRGRHLALFLALAEEAEPEALGPQQRMWWDRLETELDNLRAALEWCRAEPPSHSAGVASNAEAGLRLAGALGSFWELRGYLSEGCGWLGEALARAGAGESTGPRRKALQRASEATWMHGDYQAARAYLEQTVAVCRAVEDKGGLAGALPLLGMVMQQQGDPIAARSLIEEGVAIARDSRDKIGLGAALNGMGELMRYQGDYARAAACYEECLALWREKGNEGGVVNVLNNLAIVAEFQGDYGRAAALLEESLTRSQEHGNRWNLVWGLIGSAGLAGAAGKPDRAARLLGAADTLRGAVGAGIDPVERPHYDRYVAPARAGLSEASFAAAWAEGRALSLDQAVEYALSGWEAPNQDGA
jgi:non-specific serine/threonine protein kinase